MVSQTDFSSSGVHRIEASCPNIEVQSDWPAGKVYEGTRIERIMQVYLKMTEEEKEKTRAFIYANSKNSSFEKSEPVWVQPARYRLFLEYLRNMKWSFRTTVAIVAVYTGLNVTAIVVCFTRGEFSIVSMVEGGAFAANAVVNVRQITRLYAESAGQLNNLTSPQQVTQEFMEEKKLKNREKID